MTHAKNSGEEKFVAGNCVEIRMQEGIVYVLYLHAAEITKAVKAEMHEIFLQITGGKKHPFLFACEGSLWYTKEAREYASAIEHKQPFTAVAMFAPTFGYRLIADFYGRLYRPKTPYKVFKSKADALEWLRSYLN